MEKIRDMPLEYMICDEQGTIGYVPGLLHCGSSLNTQKALQMSDENPGQSTMQLQVLQANVTIPYDTQIMVGHLLQ
jgi:hypothetical protein